MEASKVEGRSSREKIVDLLCDTFNNRWSWTWEAKHKLDDRSEITILCAWTPAGIVVFEDYGKDGFEMFLPVLGNSIDDCRIALQERAESLTGD